MAGRIGIDDVAPVVFGRTVSGQGRGRRGGAGPGDGVARRPRRGPSATLVVRYHGTAYPRLADGPPARAQAAEPVPIEDRGHPTAAE